MAKRSGGKRTRNASPPQASKKKTTSGKRRQIQAARKGDESLISMRIALIAVGMISAGIGVFYGWRVGASLGWQQGLLWGLIVGGSVWLAFYGSYRLNRWLRRR